MTRVTITKDWTLYIIEAGEKSFLEDHKQMEIGADDERQNLFVFSEFVRTYGLRGTVNACRRYLRNKKKR